MALRRDSLSSKEAVRELGMACTTTSEAWDRQRERRDACASRASDNAAQASDVVARRVAAGKPRAALSRLDDASASPSAGCLALGFPAAMWTTPNSLTASISGNPLAADEGR